MWFIYLLLLWGIIKVYSDQRESESVWVWVLLKGCVFRAHLVSIRPVVTLQNPVELWNWVNRSVVVGRAHTQRAKHTHVTARCNHWLITHTFPFLLCVVFKTSQQCTILVGNQYTYFGGATMWKDISEISVTVLAKTMYNNPDPITQEKHQWIYLSFLFNNGWNV